MNKGLIFCFLLGSSLSIAQELQENLNQKSIDSLKQEIQSLKQMMNNNAFEKPKTEEKKEKWYDKISIGGYMQFRYNGLSESNPNLACEQCDGFWGDRNKGFSFRRLRFKISGQIGKRVFFYLQPDFAKSVGPSHYVGSLKDAYFDIGIDAENVYRIRMGQSKVPYGFGNLQSSSDRIPLDRDDAINSGLKDERDMGIYFLWAGGKQKEIMNRLYKNGLKHSGDFGVFAFGLYNGQTGNNYDMNKKFHWVTRFSYPIQLGNQIIEPGIQAYTGKFVLPKVSSATVVDADREYIDQRIAASFVLYPQPFGIQAEYNIGRGPEYDVNTQSIAVKNLKGGYVTLSYLLKKWNQTFIPFARFQHYKGGKKHELDARGYNVKEMEAGVEWQPFKYFELTAVYTYSNRMHFDFANPNYHEKGSLLRLQAQLKF